MHRHALKMMQIALVLLFIIFAFFPFYMMLKNSLEPYAKIVSLDFHFLPGSGFYFENYLHIFSHYPVIRWLGNSLLVSGTAIAANLVFDTAAAFALSRLQFKGRSVMFLLILSTLIIPIHVIIVPLYMLIVNMGWLNTYWGLIVPVMISPFGIFLLRQSFVQIPKELDEAALIDGTSRLGVLYRIILPNSLPALGTLVVIKFMWIWGDYMWPSLIIQNEKLRTLPVGIASFQNSGGTMAWDMVITGSVIAVVPIIIMFVYLQKYFISGLTEGAVKG
ncbi:carbohydrate ABC transporter permease [Paenibacillus sp. FSL H8-0034]|uniref:carbohydrate ABC transporter permease n=1 Tax=Paenibacillus sp. FSL H8-0034 TaxID=2954671 RepID=UPI0030F89C3B